MGKNKKQSQRSASSNRVSFAEVASQGLPSVSGPTIRASVPVDKPAPSPPSFFSAITTRSDERPIFQGSRVPLDIELGDRERLLGYWFSQPIPTKGITHWFFYEYGDGPVDADFGTKLQGVYWVSSERSSIPAGRYEDDKVEYTGPRGAQRYPHGLKHTTKARQTGGVSDYASESEAESTTSGPSGPVYDIGGAQYRERSRGRSNNRSQNRNPGQQQRQRSRSSSKAPQGVDIAAITEAVKQALLPSLLSSLGVKDQTPVPNPGTVPKVIPKEQPKEPKELKELPLVKRTLKGGVHPGVVFGTSTNSAMGLDVSLQDATAAFSSLKSAFPTLHYIMCCGEYSLTDIGGRTHVVCSFSYPLATAEGNGSEAATIFDMKVSEPPVIPITVTESCKTCCASNVQLAVNIPGSDGLAGSSVLFSSTGVPPQLSSTAFPSLTTPTPHPPSETFASKAAVSPAQTPLSQRTPRVGRGGKGGVGPDPSDWTFHTSPEFVPTEVITLPDTAEKSSTA
uniref:Nucleocapsid n=1 Tax=Retropinna nidovirus TaxID=3064111 RepID=A0AA50ADX6_9NIDO|nr:MAG: nucleocapsid [Retropinna nidovirus]